MIKLIKGDCLEEMDKLIKKGIKVDAVICDPPYGTTACKWDSVIPFDEMWERLKKLRKERTPIVLFGSEPFSSALRMSNIKEYKYDWIWEKNKSTGHLNAKKIPMNSYEVISIFYKKLPKYNPQYGSGKAYSNNHKVGDSGECYGKVKCSSVKNVTTRYPRRNIKFNVDMKASFHPTQKPVALMEYLIKTYTNEGDIILDFTMGSGTTGLACKNLNRNFIGIEKDDKYFKIAKERISNSAVLLDD